MAALCTSRNSSASSRSLAWNYFCNENKREKKRSYKTNWVKMLERSKCPAQVCHVSYPSWNNRLLSCPYTWVGKIDAQLSASPSSSYNIWWRWAIGVCESLPFRPLKMCFAQASTGYPAELSWLQLSSPDGCMFTRISEMLDTVAGTNTSSHSCWWVCFRISVPIRALLRPAVRRKLKENSRPAVLLEGQQTSAWTSCPDWRLARGRHTMRRI